MSKGDFWIDGECDSQHPEVVMCHFKVKTSPRMIQSCTTEPIFLYLPRLSSLQQLIRQQHHLTSLRNELRPTPPQFQSDSCSQFFSFLRMVAINMDPPKFCWHISASTWTHNKIKYASGTDESKQHSEKQDAGQSHSPKKTPASVKVGN